MMPNAIEKEASWQRVYDARRMAENRLGMHEPANDHWQKGRVGTGFHRGTQGVCEADVVRWVEDRFDPRAELLDAARRGVKSAVARCDELFVEWQKTGVMEKSG